MVAGGHILAFYHVEAKLLLDFSGNGFFGVFALFDITCKEYEIFVFNVFCQQNFILCAVGDDHRHSYIELRKFIRFAFVAIGHKPLVFAKSEGEFFAALFTIHRYSSFSGGDPPLFSLYHNAFLRICQGGWRK